VKQKLFIVLIFQFLLQAVLFAEEIPLDYMGQPFYSKQLRVGWKLTTNSLPASVRVFEIVPGHFSQTTISNLMKLGGFSETNRVWTSYRGDKLPAGVLCFRNCNDRHSLAIAPAYGIVDLDTPTFSTGLPEGVPDEARGFDLATNILTQLDIPTEQLIKTDGRLKAWFYPGEMTIYPKGGEPITHRSHMGVEFRRTLDGIYCMAEHVHIDFEDQEKITRIEIRWQGIKPSKPYPVASTQQMAAWIKEGRARVQDVEGPNDGRFLQPSEIKQITIVGVTPYYTASSYFSDEVRDDVEMSRMYPYVVLQADAEISPGDHETIWLFCPIAKGALSSISKKKTPYGFGISPSNFYEKQMHIGNRTD
jgi:hypothetical protein